MIQTKCTYQSSAMWTTGKDFEARNNPVTRKEKLVGLRDESIDRNQEKEIM